MSHTPLGEERGATFDPLRPFATTCLRAWSEGGWPGVRSAAPRSRGAVSGLRALRHQFSVLVCGLGTPRMVDAVEDCRPRPCPASVGRRKGAPPSPWRRNLGRLNARPHTDSGREASLPRSLSDFGSGPRRGELRCQTRPNFGSPRGACQGHATSRQRRMAPQIAPALRVGPASGRMRRCKCSPCRPARLRFAPSLRPEAGPTRTRPKVRQAPSAGEVALRRGRVAAERWRCP